MSIFQNIKFYELEQNFWLLMIDSLIHKLTYKKQKERYRRNPCKDQALADQ